MKILPESLRSTRMDRTLGEGGREAGKRREGEGRCREGEGRGRKEQGGEGGRSFVRLMVIYTSISSYQYININQPQCFVSLVACQSLVEPCVSLRLAHHDLKTLKGHKPHFDNDPPSGG